MSGAALGLGTYAPSPPNIQPALLEGAAAEAAGRLFKGPAAADLLVCIDVRE